jgi:hypothetical protein
MLVGRYVTIDGGDVNIYSVLARPTGVATGNDIQKLDANYAYNIDTSAVDDRSLEWGTQVAWPSSGAGAKSPVSPRSIGILFIRSPDSGNIYTFTSDDAPAQASINQATFNTLINAGSGIPGQGGRTICVLSSGLAPSSDTAIYLSPYAASASAVEVRSNDFLQSIGETTRC